MPNKKSRPAGDRAALENVLADAITNSASNPIPQPDSICHLQALHLIANRHVKPSVALTLAALAFGGAHG